jgi:hypothetical protein
LSFTFYSDNKRHCNFFSHVSPVCLKKHVVEHCYSLSLCLQWEQSNATQMKRQLNDMECNLLQEEAEWYSVTKRKKPTIVRENSSTRAVQLLDLPREMLDLIVCELECTKSAGALYLTCSTFYSFLSAPQTKTIVKETLSHLYQHGHLAGIFELLSFCWKPYMSLEPDRVLLQDDRAWSLTACPGNVSPLFCTLTRLCETSSEEEDATSTELYHYPYAFIVHAPMEYIQRKLARYKMRQRLFDTIRHFTKSITATQ